MAKSTCVFFRIEVLVFEVMFLVFLSSCVLVHFTFSG